MRARRRHHLELVHDPGHRCLTTIVTRNGRPEAVLFGTIAENPQRSGKPLRGELEGLYSACRGGFRVIYEIDEAATGVLVHRAA